MTHMRVNLKGSNIVDLDDPRIFQNPVIYMSEPGGWTTDEAWQPVVEVPAQHRGRRGAPLARREA